MADDDETEEYLRRLERPRIVRYARRVQQRPRPPSIAAGGGMRVAASLAGGQAAFVNAGPINFTVTFSEAATGFTNADVSFTGSTVGGTLAAAVTGTGPAYNVAVTGMTGNGTVVITIPAASATNSKGVAFPASNSATVTFDTTAPSVTINKGAAQADPTSASPILFDVVFSETVLGFTAADISFTGSTAGGTLVAAISGAGPSYAVSVTGMTTDGNVVASIPASAAIDLAGNASGASTSTDNIVAWTAAAGGTAGQLDFTLPANSGLQTLVLLEDI